MNWIKTDASGGGVGGYRGTLGRGWVELPAIDKPGEVTYTFTFEDQTASSSYVPQMELRIPTGEGAKPMDPPAVGAVTEVSGTLGDIKYAISSTERFAMCEWLVGEETVIAIPETSR